jgi:hypothetical protein
MQRHTGFLAVLTALGFAVALPALGQGPQGGGGRDPAGDPTIQRDRQADRDRVFDRDRITDRTQDRDFSQDRDREQSRDQLHLEDRDQLRDRDFYGAELMTEQERAQYRERLQTAQSDRAWAEIQNQQHTQMQSRAAQGGANLEPPLFGQHMMTVREREQLQQRLMAAANERDRAQIRFEHQTAMRTRARELGVELDPPMYGQRLMADAERAQLRERLAATSSEEERARIRAEHREQIQARAREHQVPLDELDEG